MKSNNYIVTVDKRSIYLLTDKNKKKLHLKYGFGVLKKKAMNGCFLFFFVKISSRQYCYHSSFVSRSRVRDGDTKKKYFFFES